MRSVIFLLFLSSVLLISCSKEDLVPDLEGNLVGYVFTFDEFAALLGDHSGITVTTEGPKKYSAVTDREGRYALKRLPAGTYSLRFEKPGFGAMKYYGIKHLGGSATIFGYTFSSSVNSHAIFLYRLPKTKILNLEIANDSLFALFDFKAELPEEIKLYVYFSELSGFPTDKAQQSVQRTLTEKDGIYKCKLFQGAFNPALPRGKEIFFRARIYNTATVVRVPEIGKRDIYGINTYFDYAFNRTIYPNIGDPSAQYSFITPE